METLSAAGLLLVGLVVNVPPLTRLVRAPAKPVIALFRLATAEICALSASPRAAYCLVFTENWLSTSAVTKAPVSMPEPTPRAVEIDCTICV